MVRIFRVYYPLRVPFLLLSDVFIVSFSFVLAAILLFQEDSFILLANNNGFWKIGLLTVLCVVSFHFFDLYDLRKISPITETYFRLLVVLGAFTFLVAALAVVYPPLLIGRGVLLLGTILLTVGLAVWRFLFRQLFRTELFREPLLVVGDEEASRELSQSVSARTDVGWEPVFFDHVRGQGQNGDERESLVDVVSRLGIRRVVVAFKERRGRMPIQDLAWLRANGVRVEEAATVLEKLTGRIDLRFASASWLAFSSGFDVTGLWRLQKRLFSLLFSLGLILISFPFVVLIALAIKLESKGPILIRQHRIGEKGRLFYAWKFRSMVEDAATKGFKPAHENDSRVTRVGRFLRPWHLDELPQLINVLRGEMSFVGPRPFVPEWEEQLEKAIPFYPLRHVVKPGLTGWAQVNRGYCETVEDNREKLEFDLFYIKNMSWTFDLWIIFQTVKIVLFDRGVR